MYKIEEDEEEEVIVGQYRPLRIRKGKNEYQDRRKKYDWDDD